MEKYNEDRKCPKCGGRASTNFIKSTGMDIEPTGLKRTCCNCGYSWFEESLDGENK